MKTVKKFKTFDELKSCEDKKSDKSATMKYHNSHKELMEEIRIIKEGESDNSQLKK